MFVPHKETKLSEVDQVKLNIQKARTKGRFEGSVPKTAAEKSSDDRRWKEAANPGFAKKEKEQALQDESMLKKRQLTRVLKAVREERRAGIKVSKVPPELQHLVNSLVAP